jgi:E-phenylitaconyl-CoA hydratase
MSIEFSVDGLGIATIVINRPEKMNALDPEHYRGLSDAWIQVRDRADIRCAVITGAGEKAFCAGADLKASVGVKRETQDLWLTQKGQLLNRGLEVWKPVVAAINGLCLGGGVTLLLATDIRFAVPEATFGLTEVKRGLIPSNGGTQRVINQLPYPIAMQMLLTGEAIAAQTAERWGMVNGIVERGKLMDAAYACARSIAANAPLAVQAAKELAIRSRDLSLTDGLRMEMLVSHTLQNTEDLQEKRPAKFQGR